MRNLRSLRYLTCLMMCAGLTGCGAAALYDSTSVEHSPYTADQLRGVRKELEADLGETSVDLEDSQRAVIASGLSQLPAPALVALWFAVHSGDKQATEADRWILTGPGQRVAVTVRRDDKRWTVHIGPPNSSQPQGYAGDLMAKWGIGPLEEVGRQWSPLEIARLDLALARLSRDEQQIVAGMPFVRAGSSSERLGGLIVAGYYHYQGCAARIELFDRAFANDDTNFVGEPELALPASLLTILHEIGHAIARRPAREASCAATRAQARFNMHVEEFNNRVGNFNALPASARARAESFALDRERSEVEQERAQLADRWKAVAELADDDGPVLRAFGAALGRQRGPTRYSFESLEESFAESFALFRSDPEALRRLLPSVSDFFERGEHLRAASSLQQ